jgi:nucleoside-diphosphate-sugar epimerase
MNVFLTGATGYIGGAVADALIAAGHRVTGLARSDEAAEKLERNRIAVHRGDISSPGTLVNAAKESDGVIHAGTTNNGDLDKAAVEAMLDALHGSGKPFLYTSGIWVLGNTGGVAADESFPLNPIPKVAWRPAVERAVLDAAAQGVRTIVIRPGIVFGGGGGIPADFVKSVKNNGSALYVGTGENHWPLVHLNDLADLYVLALEKGPAGELFHATDGSAHTVKEIAASAGKTASWPLDEARKTLGAYADALVLDQQVSSAKARAMLGWQPHAGDILDHLR